MRRFLLLCVLCALASCQLASCQSADTVAHSVLLQQCADSTKSRANTAPACEALIDAPNVATETLVFALDGRARARVEAHDLDGALADANRAVELSPNRMEVLATRATLHGLRGEYEPAVRDFRAALEHSPNTAELHADLGTAYERWGKPELALPAYDRAIELDPTFAGAIGARCWVRVVLNRDLDKAIADCDRAMQLDPNDLNHYNSRGFARFRQKQYEQAIADYDRSLGGPPAASSFYMRGLAKRALGRTEEGDADITRGKQLEPGVADRYARFGVAAP